MAAAASASTAGGGGGVPGAIAGALMRPLGVDPDGTLDISNYNQICREVTGYKQILVRNGDTIHDFGGSRGQVAEDDGREYTRIKALITAEKTVLNSPPPGDPRFAQYAEILAKYNNLTQGSNFEDTMFRGLLPPQVTLTYNNEGGPVVIPPETTRLVINTDTIDGVNKAIQIKNDIYRFLWPETISGPNLPGAYEFKIMADVSPGNEIKKIATLSLSDSSVKIRVRVTPESVMDAGPTYNANNDKILPGFGEFVASPLNEKWHPTPVYSLPYVGIKTRVRAGYGVNNPKAFDVIFQKQQADGNGPTLTIPHDEYDSGPGVEYIARSAAGVPVGEIKAGMLPFYDIIRNGAYSGAAHAVGLLREDHRTLTDLGKNIGYDLKREGDQSQAIAVLMSYRAGEKVVLATQDRMLALFMILMGGPVIHVGTGKTTIYRGERLNLTPEQKRQVLIRDINEIIGPIVTTTDIETITRLTTQCREYIDMTIEKYRRHTGKLLNIPYMLLMGSLADIRAGISRFIKTYVDFVRQRGDVLAIVEDLNSKNPEELQAIRTRIIGPVHTVTSSMASITAAIETLKSIRFPLKKLDLGDYGYIDLPAINSLNKVLKRYVAAARSGFRSKKIFEGFKDSIVSNFGIVYSRLTDETRTELRDIEVLLSSLTQTRDEGVIAVLEEAPAAAAAAEASSSAAAAAAEEDEASVATGATAPGADVTAARAGLAAAVAGAPPAVPDINTVTNINTPYEFCVRVVDVLYSTIRPLIMFGKGRTEDVLGQIGGVKDRYGRVRSEETAERRKEEFHPTKYKNQKERRAALQKEQIITAQRRRGAELYKKRMLPNRVKEAETIFDDSQSTLALKIMSLEDDLPVENVRDPRTRKIIPITAKVYLLILDILKTFLQTLYDSGPTRGLRILQTMRGILVEGDPRFPYDGLYGIDTLPGVLTILFDVAGGAPPADPLDYINAFGRKSMPSQTKRRSRKCPRGTIRRKGYTTKRGVTVRSSCIKDRGLPGKGKRLFTLKKGELSKHGYSLKYAREKRHAALNKARKELSHATLVRKINALAVLMKNTHPDYARRARADVKWLGKTRA